MDDERSIALWGIAADADIERTSALADATARFTKFLADNVGRLKSVGGLVLIDDEPEYLAINADGTFTSRSRYQNDEGEDVTEDEVIESAAELVEIYNPADLYAAFADAARDDAGGPDRAITTEDSPDAGVATAEAGDDPDEPGDSERTPAGPPSDEEDAARKLYDLALTFQERSQQSEAQLLDSFEYESEKLAAVLGDKMILDEEDERLWYRATGAFEAEVVPEPDEDAPAGATGQPDWQALSTPEDIVQFYDPTDVFGNLAEAIAEDHPDVAPELDDESAS